MVGDDMLFARYFNSRPLAERAVSAVRG